MMPYLWSNGDTNKKVTIKTEGLYSVSIHDNNGCKASSKAIAVTVKLVPELKIYTVGKYPICDGDTVILRATIGFSKYFWS